MTTDNDNQELSEVADVTAPKQVIGRPFPKGVSGNPKGRPKGTISPITKVKQMFEDNPEIFAAFIKEYISNPNNHKHIVEMIDGRPVQDITSKGEAINPTPIYGGQSIQVHEHDSNQESLPAQEENQSS